MTSVLNTSVFLYLIKFRLLTVFFGLDEYKHRLSIKVTLVLVSNTYREKTFSIMFVFILNSLEYSSIELWAVV